MKVGDLIRLQSFINCPVPGVGFTFRARKGEKFVAVLLGVEPTDGSAPLDSTEVLQSLGWTPPPEEDETTPEAPGAP